MVSLRQTKARAWARLFLRGHRRSRAIHLRGGQSRAVFWPAPARVKVSSLAVRSLDDFLAQTQPSRSRRSEPSMASPRMTSCSKLSSGSPQWPNDRSSVTI